LEVGEWFEAKFRREDGWGNLKRVRTKREPQPQLGQSSDANLSPLRVGKMTAREHPVRGSKGSRVKNDLKSFHVKKIVGNT